MVPGLVPPWLKLIQDKTPFTFYFIFLDMRTTNLSLCIEFYFCDIKNVLFKFQSSTAARLTLETGGREIDITAQPMQKSRGRLQMTCRSLRKEMVTIGQISTKSCCMYIKEGIFFLL